MHRLKVISFDKVLSERDNEIETREKKFRRHHDYKIHHKTVSTHKKTPQRPKVNISTNTERKVTQKDNYTGLNAAKKISIASMSELLRLRTNGNILKRFSSIKTISFDDIRKILMNNVYGHKRQKKINQCHKINAACMKTVKKRHVESQNDIKVLYSFQRSKSPDSEKMDCYPKKKSSKGNNFIRRTSSDIFGIGRIRQNTYLCFHTTRNTGLLPTPMRRKKKTESTPHILHASYPSNISIPNRKPKKLRFQNESTSDHYNVVCFPRRGKLDVGDQQRLEPLKFSVKEVKPSPSSVPFVSVDQKGDTHDCVCIEVNKMKPKSGAIENQINDPEKKKENSFLQILKDILKYLLIVICFIVWLPCILAVAGCWLIVYPLKPHYVFGDHMKTETENKNIFTKIMECHIRTSRFLYGICPTILKNGNKLPKSITPSPSQKAIHRMPCQKGIQRRPSHIAMQRWPSQIAIKSRPSPNAIHRRDQITPSNWEPNPGKRYILFFDDDRGWLMKPIRYDDSSDYTSKKKPKVVQNLRFDRNNSPRPQRAVRFSKTIQEKATKSNHICQCPPKSTVKTTQANLQETPLPKKGKIESTNDKISKLVIEPSKPVIDPSKPIIDPSKPVIEPPKPVTKPNQKKANNSKPVAEPDKKNNNNTGPMTEPNKNNNNNPGPMTEPNKNNNNNSGPMIEPDKKINNNSGPMTEPDKKNAKASKSVTKPDQEQANNEAKYKKTRPCEYYPPPMKVPCKKRKNLAPSARGTKPQLQSRIKTRVEQRQKSVKYKAVQARECRRKNESQLKYKSKAVPYRYKKPTLRKKLCKTCKCCAQNLQEIVSEAEDLWDIENCQDMYLHTLRRKPCFWIYHCCRSMYPTFLSCHRACCNLCYVLLFLLAILVWLPTFLFCYLSCQLIIGCCN